MTQPRNAPINMSGDEFRALGHDLVDRIAELLDSMPDRPVTPGEGPSVIRELVGPGPVPVEGTDAVALLAQTTDLLFDHSLHNGHPRFLGYITAAPAPIGILGDMLAAAVNPNLGAWALSPVASEIEWQCIRWIAELLGYPTDCGGLLVSGGNMANFVAFLAARRAKAGWDVRKDGMAGANAAPLRAYASSETHTWLEKATDMFGLGTGAIRSAPVDRRQRADVDAMRRMIEEDRAAGAKPFLVVGTAGSVGTGAVDPLDELAALCKEYDLWFHVDGAYGAFAAMLPEMSDTFTGMADADSIAVDPHKWLYAPLEAGAVLVRDKSVMMDTFSYVPPYYKFDGVKGEDVDNFVLFGPQNSKGFRALKVWLGLRQVGRSGYERMIADDIAMARRLFDNADADPELEAVTHDLSLTTFRFKPEGVPDDSLDDLNKRILTRMQEGGEAYVSHTLVDGRYVLRACVVNFRTAEADMDALPGIVKRIGREVLAESAEV